MSYSYRTRYTLHVKRFSRLSTVDHVPIKELLPVDIKVLKTPNTITPPTGIGKVSGLDEMKPHDAACVLIQSVSSRANPCRPLLHSKKAHSFD